MKKIEFLVSKVNPESKIQSKWPLENGSYNVFTESEELFVITENCQPERSKREDSRLCEMRCSEHCGNTVRDK